MTFDRILQIVEKKLGIDDSPRVVYGWVFAACGTVLLFATLTVIGTWLYDGGSRKTIGMPSGASNGTESVRRYLGTISPSPTAVSSCKFQSDKLVWGGCVVLAGKAPLTRYGVDGDNFFCAYGDGKTIKDFLAYAIAYCLGNSH